MTAVDAGTRPATPAPAAAPDIAEESSAFAPGAFGARHIGIDSEARATMLGVLGHDSIPSLLAKAVPETIQVDRFRTEGDSVLPEAATERDALAELRRIAGRNRVRTSMI